MLFISEPVFRWMLIGWALIAVVAFFGLLLIPAPYGRHLRSGWGPRMPSGINWFIMEVPALLVFVVVVLQSLPHHMVVLCAVVPALRISKPCLSVVCPWISQHAGDSDAGWHRL